MALTDELLVANEEVKKILGFSHINMAQYLLTLKQQKQDLEDRISKAGVLTQKIVEGIRSQEEDFAKKVNTVKQALAEQNAKTNVIIKAVLEYGTKNGIDKELFEVINSAINK